MQARRAGSQLHHNVRSPRVLFQSPSLCIFLHKQFYSHLPAGLKWRMKQCHRETSGEGQLPQGLHSKPRILGARKGGCLSPPDAPSSPAGERGLLGTCSQVPMARPPLRAGQGVLSKHDRFICTPALLETAQDRPQEHWAEGRDGGAGQDDPLSKQAWAAGPHCTCFRKLCRETPSPDVWADFCWLLHFSYLIPFYPSGNHSCSYPLRVTITRPALTGSRDPFPLLCPPVTTRASPWPVPGTQTWAQPSHRPEPHRGSFCPAVISQVPPLTSQLAPCHTLACHRSISHQHSRPLTSGHKLPAPR